MPNKLAQLGIDEVSGVDEPANQIPGWLLAKSKELEGVLEEVEGAHSGLLDALETAGEYLADAPDEVQTAADLLKSHVASLADSDDDRRSFIGRALAYFKRKEDIEMNKEELLEVLAERETAQAESIAKAVAEAVAAAIPAPAEVVTPEAKETEETEETEETTPVAGPTQEAFDTLSERVEAVAEAVEKSLETIGKILEKSAKRQSLDGQDEIEKGKEDKTSPLSKAFAAALKGERVDLR